MPLFLNIDDVRAADLSGLNARPEDRVASKGHDMKRVHGTEAAFAISLRKSGYHSYPHIHDFEQLNCIQEGEMWFFILDKAARWAFLTTARTRLRRDRPAARTISI